ncbi:MAG: apolipoprotein N-acyltransferase [Deltaproteobacteria bacterium]
MTAFFPILSGLLIAGAFPPFSLSHLIWFCLVPLLFAVAGKGIRKGMSYGLVTGFVSFFGILWWLAPTISRFGHLPPWFSWPVICLLIAYLAIYPAVWAGGAAWVSRKSPILGPIALLPAAWTLLEWLREHLFSGFPWASLAYALSKSPSLIQTADLWGHFGISYLIVLANVLLWIAVSAPKPSWRPYPVLAVVLGLLFLHLHGSQRIRSVMVEDALVPALAVSAVQGNVPQDIKWDPGFQAETIAIYRDLSREAVRELGDLGKPGRRLLVWPETSAPFYFQEDGPLRIEILGIARDLDTMILLGSPAYEDGSDGMAFFNSAFLVGPDGSVAGRYDKVHLVPFGEYLPLGPLSAWAKDLLPFAGDFREGESSRPLAWGMDVKVGCLICFESIFPDRAREIVRQGADVIAVITNDAWFGRTGAPYQHEDMAVFRAVETRRWLVRSANTGVSSIISPWGERTAQTKIFERTAVSGEVRLRNGQGLYVRTGPTFFLTLCLALVIFALFYASRKLQREERI